MTTHTPAHAFQYGSLAVLMSRGRVVAFDTPLAALTEERLFEAYGIPLRIAQLSSPAGEQTVVLSELQ